MTTRTEWMDSFLVELRLRNVRGDAIGDAAADVESYCADSGQTPTEAFGEPGPYARSLAFPQSAYVASNARAWTQTLAPVATGLAAMFLAGPTAASLRHGEGVPVSWGILTTLLAPIVFALWLLADSGRLLPSPRAGLAACGASVLALIALSVAAGHFAPTIPAPVLLILVGSLLAATAWLARRFHKNSRHLLVDPRDGAVRIPAGISIVWLFVAGVLLNAAIGWVTAA